MKTILLILAAALAAPAAAQNLTGLGASAVDSSGAARETFSSGEAITLRQRVNVVANSLDPVTFSFEIISPAGGVVFSHGVPNPPGANSAPGTQGGAQSQLSGISIASFYTAPGNYTFRAKAAQTGSSTVEQTDTFTISSPNITLIYPPYGARGLSDKPLIFRWTASGATRYRVTVADNAGLYNPAHEAVNSGENSYAYPDNPSQPREQLVPEQVYYWKVEGLDASNNRISESTVYNFSLRSQAASQTRNVAITALDLSSPVLDFEKPLNFKATLFNSGATAESNISVKMSLGGIGAQDSPKQVISIAAGERQDIPFTAFMPSGQEEGLAVACADLFDDNMTDNCKTRLISKNAGAGVPKPSKKLSYEEMFQEILKRLGPDAAKALEGYTFENLTCANCSQEELSAIISALISGEAQLVNASVLDSGAGETGGAGQTQTAASSAGETAAAEPVETSFDIPEMKDDLAGEWSGFTEPSRAKTGSGFVIRDRKAWKKFWKTISTEDVPDVDFGSKMVVGIISGKADRAESVRILGQRKTEEGIAFDYYFIEAPAGAKAELAAYLLKVYDRVEEKAEFKRLDVKK